MGKGTEEVLALAKKNGLEARKDSPFFGRYRLQGDQVSPNYRPSYDVYLKLNAGAEGEVRGLCEELDFPVAGLFSVLGEADFKNPYMSISYPFEANDRILVFCMVADVSYIGEENIVAGFQLFSEYLEDGHFFVYSTGDGDDRWVHEYRVSEGRLSFERHLLEEAAYMGRIDFYLSRDYRSPDWLSFLKEQVEYMAPRAKESLATKWREKFRSKVEAGPLAPQVEGRR